MEKNQIKSIALIVISLYFSFASYSQEIPKESADGPKLHYTSDFAIGAPIMHSHGWGANFRKSKRITGYKKRLLALEFVTMKHPKEQKTYNQDYDDTKGFIYGKLHSLGLLRGSWGKQKILYTKETKKGVQISYLYLGGISMGLAKPVYLQIKQPNTPVIKTERYTAEEDQKISDIHGRAPLMKGLEETNVYPGLHAKFGLNFEYAPDAELIRAIETGITLDAFHKKIPVMAFTDNRQFFVTLYVNWQFGKKYY